MAALRFRAAALAAGLVGWSALIGPRLPARVQPGVHAVLAGVLALSARAPLGLRPPQLWSGLRLGVAAATPVIVQSNGVTVLLNFVLTHAERRHAAPH